MKKEELQHEVDTMLEYYEQKCMDQLNEYLKCLTNNKPVKRGELIAAQHKLCLMVASDLRQLSLHIKSLNKE